MNPQITQKAADFLIPSNSTGLAKLVEIDQFGFNYGDFAAN